MLGKENSGSGTVLFQIEGMECGCEATLIEKKLRALEGVQKFDINPITHQLRVFYDPGSVTTQDIIRSVSETGMRASMQKSKGPRSTWWREKQQLALYGCGILALVAFVFEKMGYPPAVSIGLYILSVLTGIYYPARKALIALLNLTPTIHLLMLIGSAGAMLLGMWGESAVLIFVYSLGDVLESYAVDKARGALRSLTELMPREALVKTGSGEQVRSIEQIFVGDIVVVRPGERIPVDGRVLRGTSYVDQSAVTGEPIPVLRKTGGDVFAGTINQNGSLEVQVQKPASETMLSKIICSVEEAQAKKGKLQRFSDAFGVYYTPAMFVLGILVAVIPPLLLGYEWGPFLYRGLVVFVVSCSCGLALSVPVAIVAAMAKAAHNGTVFKGGAYIELVDHVKVVAFDKTGTLTIGRPEVTDILAFGGTSEKDVLDISGTLESRSGHPLAAAILRKARENEFINGKPIENYLENPGRGVTAMIQGRYCILGSPRSLEEQEIGIGDAENKIAGLEDEGKTVVLLGVEGKLAGLIAISDTLRPGALEALERLKSAGVKTVMLTGDNERSARAIAARLGVDEFEAQLLPTDKVDVIRKLREKYGMIAMVGDGINDAPAMAVADVGIAMGAAGTDIAIEAGDVVLMSDDLGKIAYLRELSNQAIRNIRQNIWVSMINVAFMVIMALLGYLGLVTGLLLNEASALFVIANALRLLKWRGSIKSAELPAGQAKTERIQTISDSTSPFTIIGTASCCSPPNPTPSIQRLNTVQNSGCCSGAESNQKIVFPTFTMAAAQASCCSSPATNTPDDNGNGEIHGVNSLVFRIDGMSCSCEGQMVERRVNALKGVKNFSFNPITNQMKVTLDPLSVSVKEIETAVSKAGAKAILIKGR